MQSFRSLHTRKTSEQQNAPKMHMYNGYVQLHTIAHAPKKQKK